MGSKNSSQKTGKGLAATKKENPESMSLRRIRDLETKLSLIERGLDVNVDGSSAVLLFIQHHSNFRTEALSTMMVGRFTVDELERALVIIGEEIVEGEGAIKVASRIVESSLPDKFQHRRNDRRKIANV